MRERESLLKTIGLRWGKLEGGNIKLAEKVESERAKERKEERDKEVFFF